MKLQRYTLYRGLLEPTTNGGWVKYVDAEALKLAVERATANMVAAQNRAAELEGALRDVALMPCDCFRNSGCGSCSAREALKALETKG
jgi:hypothetical protein